MKSKRLSIVMLIAAILVLAVACLLMWYSSRKSLEQWIQAEKQPGYELIYAKKIDEAYIALFDDSIVILRSEEPSEGGSVTDVGDSNGKSLFDKQRRTRPIARTLRLPVIAFTRLVGGSHPIKPGYTGALQITYSKLMQIGDEKGLSTGP